MTGSAGLDAGKTFELSGCTTHTMDSAAVGEAYTVHLARPSGSSPARGWPLILLLDANASFASCVDTMRRMARRPDATGVSEMLVVGVDHAAGSGKDARQRDYAEAPDAFRGFLTEELLPAIHASVPIDEARRTLMGHSLAGYFTLSSLASPFSRFAAFSPSLWFDFKGLKELIQQEASGKGVFLAVGEWEETLAPFQQNQPGSEQVLSRRQSRQMVSNVTRLMCDMREIGGITPLESHVLPAEDHASIVTAAMPKALRFASASPL